MNNSSEQSEKLQLGKVLQSIDNEEIILEVNGKRARMSRAEAYFWRLFCAAIGGDLATARLIANMAALYFSPEAAGPGEVEFVVDYNRYPSGDQKSSSAQVKKKRSKKGGDKPRQARGQISTASLFRKIARAQVPIVVDGKRSKMPCWDVYLRSIYDRALNMDKGAARLLDRIRKQFPGDLLPGDKQIYLITPEDAGL